MTQPVNLALHLRLARILTGKSAAGEARLGPEALECLAVLDDLMVAMDERAELLRLPEAVESVEVEVEVEVKEPAATAPEPEAPPPEEPAAEAVEDAPTVAVDQVLEGPIPWGRLHDQLYEDVLWLFKMGDNEGALNSLGRLMDFGAGTEELTRFLTINRDKLFDLYHKLVGEPDALVERRDAVIGDRYFFQRAEVELLLEQVNGTCPVSEVIEASELPDLKVYSYLHRIRREGLVRIRRADTDT